MKLIISGSAVTKRFKTALQAINWLETLDLADDCEFHMVTNDLGQLVYKFVDEDGSVWAMAVVTGEN